MKINRLKKETKQVRYGSLRDGDMFKRTSFPKEVR